MFYDDGFLHAVVEDLPGDADLPSGGSERREAKESGAGSDGAGPTDDASGSRAVADGDGVEGVAKNGLDDSVGAAPPEDDLEDEPSNGQRREEQRERREREAKKRRRRSDDGEADGSSRRSVADPAPLRLHQFVSTAFRSELNVAENGTGYFIKNAPRVSAHHALLQGTVKLNGEVCKIGRVTLRRGDVVSLRLDPEEGRQEGKLVSWKGSEAVAKGLEGNAAEGGRKGRMMAVSDGETIKNDTLKDCDMLKYYRERLGKIWVPKIHETAITQPLPLTLRVLKGSGTLGEELAELGFRAVTDEDVSLQVSSLYGHVTKRLIKDVLQELLRDAWILDSSDRSESSERRLGVFLSEARVTGEIMQQELASMLPIAIVASDMENRTFWRGESLRFLDLCAAPGSKTCQLLSALGRKILRDESKWLDTDFAVVANEISPRRANWMQHRLHQQSGGPALSNLIVTCADGCDFAKMEPNSFDYVVCDVPCSGDGTARKSPKVLGKWSPDNAKKNKRVQKELLKVGLGLLRSCEGGKDGGILVYSTCSLHPAENEEVVSEVMEELNEREEIGFKFELVGLSDKTSTSNGDDSGTDSGPRDDILRVLPAKSHGGFFVAGIRKLEVADADVIPSPRKNDTNANIVQHELVRQSVVISAEKTTITHSISPCARRCRAEISKRMGDGVIVGGGVAVMHEGADGARVFQQGCAALLSPAHGVIKNGYLTGSQELAGYTRLSRADMIACHGRRAAYREAVLSVCRLCNMTGCLLEHLAEPNPGRPLIIVVDSTFLLPAKIIEPVRDDLAIVTGTTYWVVVKILARPQILGRALMGK